MPELRSHTVSDPGDAWLGPILTDRRLVTTAQLDELAGDVALWTGVVGRGWASDDAIASAFRLPRADLPAAEARVTTLVPEALARRHGVLPLSAAERTIEVATADPQNLDLEQTLRFVTGREVAFRIAAPAAIAERLDALWRPERTIERLLVGREPADVEAVDEGFRLPGEGPRWRPRSASWWTPSSATRCARAGPTSTRSRPRAPS